MLLGLRKYLNMFKEKNKKELEKEEDNHNKNPWYPNLKIIIIIIILNILDKYMRFPFKLVWWMMISYSFYYGT